MVLELLGCVGRAVLRQSVKDLFLDCLPLSRPIYEIAKDALGEWKKRRDAKQRRQEMEAVVQLPKNKFLDQTHHAAKGVADTPAEREAVAVYLSQIPGQARRTLSRPGDLAGLTVQATIPFNQPNDLVTFLPLRLSPLREGQEVGHNGNTWKLLELLGIGGFGEVWKAENLYSPGGEVALKFCLDPTKGLDSLRREVALLRRLGQCESGIVPLLRDCLDAPQPFLVFEYIPGGDLVRLIDGWHTHRPPTAGLVPESIRLIRCLAEILSPAHEAGIVHRDLKPSNILLQPGSRTGYVRLRVSDFGIGDVASSLALGRVDVMTANESLTTSLRGALTLLYASPQQMIGNPADPRDDVYALGVIGYQILNGTTQVGPPPFWDDELRERHVPPAVINVFGSCLATPVERRPRNARALVDALDTAVAEA